MEFNERLKELRIEKNLTQQEIANQLKITRSAYSLYELGVREPNFALLKQIAKFFSVSVDYLIGYSDDY